MLLDSIKPRSERFISTELSSLSFYHSVDLYITFSSVVSDLCGFDKGYNLNNTGACIER